MSPCSTGTMVDALQLAAAVGAFSLAQEEALSARGVTLERLRLDSSATRDFVYTPGRDPAVLPFTISETGLAWFSTSPLPPSRLVLVVGDEPWDFALFYALRRMGGAALWLPSDYVADRSTMIDVSLAVSAIDPEEIAIATAHSAHQIRPAIEAIASYSSRAKIQEVAWKDAIPDSPRRLLVRDLYGVPQPLLLDAEERSGHLPTPVPTVRVEPEHETRWMTDVRVEGWQPVLSSRLGPSVIESKSYGSPVTRTTRDGAAFFCPHFMWFGGDLDGQTIRSRAECGRLKWARCGRLKWPHLRPIAAGPLRARGARADGGGRDGFQDGDVRADQARS